MAIRVEWPCSGCPIVAPRPASRNRVANVTANRTALGVGGACFKLGFACLGESQLRGGMSIQRNGMEMVSPL
eukprot:6899724-Lingulodinium_polyedra.AAC.1